MGSFANCKMAVFMAAKKRENVLWVRKEKLPCPSDAQPLYSQMKSIIDEYSGILPNTLTLESYFVAIAYTFFLYL